MSSFIIKLIAILTMTIDHVNDIFYHLPLLNIIGRIAFPLFCFQVVVGYSKTRDLKKYLLRLFLFAIISQIPYYFFMKLIQESLSTNVIVTLLIGIISMYIYDINIENKNGKLSLIDSRDNDIVKKMSIKYEGIIKIFCVIIKYASIIILMIISYIIKADYNAWGILLVLIIHTFYPLDGNIKLSGKTIQISKFVATFLFLIIMIIMSFAKYYLISDSLGIKYYIKYSLATFIPAIIIMLSNGKKGISLKYFFYIYYPLHLTIILVIEKLISMK